MFSDLKEWSVLKYFLFLSNVGTKKICLHLYPYSEKRDVWVQIFQAAIFGTYGQSWNIWTYVCLFVYVYEHVYLYKQPRFYSPPHPPALFYIWKVFEMWNMCLVGRQ